MRVKQLLQCLAVPRMYRIHCSIEHLLTCLPRVNLIDRDGCPDHGCDLAGQWQQAGI
jgi:hypothetical protein